MPPTTCRWSYVFLLHACLLFGACGASPLAPTPEPPPVIVAPPPLPIALAGQSNPNLMFAPFVTAYAPGKVVGEKALNPGSTIQQWAEGGPLWTALAPDLRQPLRAFVWWQGESDRHPGQVELLESETRAFIARVRKEANDPNLLVIICRVVDDPIFAGVRAAQAAYVASDPRSVLVSSDGLPLEGPRSAHLSPQGYIAMTERILRVLP